MNNSGCGGNPASHDIIKDICQNYLKAHDNKPGNRAVSICRMKYIHDVSSVSKLHKINLILFLFALAFHFPEQHLVYEE